MKFLARDLRSQPIKSALLWISLAVLATLAFHFLRARRLLLYSREIATQSALFPRHYSLGSGPEITYLAMGDSTAAGWGAGDLISTYPHQIASALAARHFRVHVVNVAVGGATLSQVRRDQGAFLKTVRPDFITLSVGANDATRGTSAADFRRELLPFFVDLESSSAQRVLVANVPELFLAPALPFPLALISGRRARDLNPILQARPASKIQVVDLFGRGKLDFRRDPNLYAADLFHPSGRGYAVWANLFVEKLELNAFSSAPFESKQR